MNDAVIFQETQTLSPKIKGIVIMAEVVALLVTLFVLSSQGAMADLWWVIALIVAIACPTLFAMMAFRMHTTLTAEGLQIRMPLLLNRTIAIGDIEHADHRQYRPLAEYGGWGIRFGPNGLAYNTRGNQGVQLTLTDGKKILIGSQQPETLANAIHKAMG